MLEVTFKKMTGTQAQMPESTSKTLAGAQLQTPKVTSKLLAPQSSSSWPWSTSMMDVELVAIFFIEAQSKHISMRPPLLFSFL